MDTITVSKTFEGDLRGMLDRCRTLDSRKFWPGSQLMSSGADVLYYMASMRLKGTNMTDIDIEEKLSPVEEQAGGTLAFKTTQKVSWPSGHAYGDTEYVFTPGSPNTLTFTYHYEPPGTKLVKPKELPAFHAGMQKVAARYLDALTAAPVNA